MALVTSCDGLYFTDPPMDNVLTLTWEPAEGTPPTSYSFVLFKVKSTAPKLFHVLPRYGSLLLSGEETMPSPVFTHLTISLRDTHRGGSLSENGTSENAAMARRGSSVPGQERFSVEYLCVTGEESAYTQLAQSPGAAKSLWPLAATGKLRATAIMTIPLLAFTENVTTDFTRSGDANVVVVPPTAKLTRPTLQEHAAIRLSMQAQEHAAGGVLQRSRGVADGEMRASKSGIEALRHNKPDMSGEQEQEKRNGRGRTQDVGDNIVMRTRQPTWEERKMHLNNIASQRGGIPFVFVLLAMFTVYFCVMLAWRERGAVTSLDS